MTYFKRLQKIGNPYHAANGEFTSAGNAGSGGSGAPTPRAPLPTLKHHGENAFAATMNMFKSSVNGHIFKQNYGIYAQAVHDVLKNNANGSTQGKAQLIWEKLRDSGNAAVKDSINSWTAPRDGNAIYTRLKDTLRGHEVALSPANPATVTHDAPAGAVSAVFPRASSTATASPAAASTGSRAASASSTGLTRAGNATFASAGPASRNSVSGPSAATSTARAMSSPQAASVAATPSEAPTATTPKVTIDQIKAAGFSVNNFADTEGMEKAWPKVFGGQTPAQVMNTMFKDKIGRTFDVNLSSDGSTSKPALRLQVNNDAVTITRRFEVQADDSVVVDHAYFEIKNDSAQGNDFSKKLLGNSMELYKRINVSAVDVHANIDVGGYAWAKYGFTPNADSWGAMQRRLSQKVQATPVDEEFTAGKKESLLRMLKNTDPRTAWDFSDSKITTANAPRDRKGDKIPLAKSCMLGSDWYGRLDLRSPVVMERFNDYVKKGRG